jgi:hypothetical protein
MPLKTEKDLENKRPITNNGEFGLSFSVATYRAIIADLNDIMLIEPDANTLQEVLDANGSATNVSGMSVASNGSGVGITDDDGAAIAEINAIGNAFGVGFAQLRFDDTNSGGGDQSINLSGNTGIGGNGIILTDSANSKGIENAADYSSNFVNESLVTKRWVDAQIGSAGIYAGSGSLSGATTVTTGSNNLTFSGAGSVIFNETGTATAGVRMEGDTSSTLFNLVASSNNIGINVAPNAQSTLHAQGKTTGSAGRITGWFGNVRTDGEGVAVYATASGTNTGNNVGLWASVDSLGANNYAISTIAGNPNASATNWNLHLASLAQNYMEGSLGIGIEVPTVKLDVDGVVKVKSYTVATVPTSVAGGLIYVSDEVGGAVTAFGDGTNWRRVTDRAIVTT